MRAQTKSQGIGKVRVETGYWIPGELDHIRCPDVSFVRASRLATEEILHGAVTQVPDLAIEITSPSDRDTDIQEKVDDYLRGGVQRVWVVRPELRTVTVHRPNRDAHTFGLVDTLDADDAAIPEVSFSVRVADIFA
jgi:Uma2 family endonuclease